MKIKINTKLVKTRDIRKLHNNSNPDLILDILARMIVNDDGSPVSQDAAMEFVDDMPAEDSLAEIARINEAIEKSVPPRKAGL